MKLRLVGPESQVRELELTSEVTTIGRSAECDIVLPDQTVSRVHISIHLDNEGRTVILDSQSRYGTVINGEQIPNEEVVLRLGEELEIGAWRGSIYDGDDSDISNNPTVDMEHTSLQTPASTRKTRLLKVQKRRSSGYLILLLAMAALGGVMLAYILFDAF